MGKKKKKKPPNLRAHRSFHCPETKLSLLGGPFLTTTHQGLSHKKHRDGWLTLVLSLCVPLPVYSANRNKHCKSIGELNF